MAKGRFGTLTSWSYSVYTQYLKCPFSVCLDKIQRVRITEPDNPAFIKGDKVHAAADQHVSFTGKKPPKLIPELSAPAVQEALAKARAAKARTEQEWAFTRQWVPTGWFDKDAWLRVKTDVCSDTIKPPTVDIIDWKTGKPWPDHAQQRSLYGLGGLVLVQTGVLAGGSKDVELTAKHIYTDTGQSATEKFGMKHLKPLQREWLARIKEMMKDTVYPTKTGSHCKYCRFARSRGGPCPEKM